MLKNKLVFSVIAIIGLTGCVKNMYDSSKEGGTVMDRTTCQNGVCSTYGPVERKQHAAPTLAPSMMPNPMASPESTLPLGR